MFAKQRLRRLVVCLAPVACVALVLGWFLLAGEDPVAAQLAATTPEPVLKVYSCPPIATQSVAAQLRQQYQGIPNVRIGADDRLGQILVQAPPTVQAQIAQTLANPPQPSPSSQPAVRTVSAVSAPPATPAPNALKSQTVALRNTTARQMEASLVGSMGSRFAPIPTGSQLVSDYRLALQGGDSLSVSLQMQNNTATVQGVGVAVDSFVRLLEVLDSPAQPGTDTVRAVALRDTNQASANQIINAVGTNGQFPGRLTGMPGMPDAAALETGEVYEIAPPAEGAGMGPLAGVPAVDDNQDNTLVEPVQVQMLTDLDVLVVTGKEGDVERVMKIIAQVERLSAETEPVIIVHPLQHVNCEALAELIIPLYSEVYEARQGTASITALVKPNALLLIGRRDNLQTVLELVNRLDRPVAPETEFQVFRLRHAAASAVQVAITEQIGTEMIGLAPRVVVTLDYRSNALIVRASPRDMLEVARLIERMDTLDVMAQNEIRVFPLFNAAAEEVATTLIEAIGGTQVAADQDVRSAALSFVAIDTQGQRRMNSAVLSDVRITPQVTSNTLLVTAPTESMQLLDSLIHELDKPPVAETQIKVFTIINGDAQTLTDMLTSLFPADTTGTAAVAQTAALEGESALVPLQFVADIRTNTIIASGSAGELMVVDAILTRLDESESRQRRTEVYRLRNAPALDVSNAITNYLSTETTILQLSALSPADQVQREIVIVPEAVSNSLIVSATPRYFDEIVKLIEELDARPPMVMIQVLIAEVSLNDVDEFGVEIGVQDSLLFDRSQLSIIDTLTTTTTTQTGGNTVTTTNDEIVSADVTPGYAFNNQPLPNTGVRLDAARILASQGLATFGVGRVNSELGYGGMVLSASSDVLSILVRALQDERRLEILSRPQITTMDNQPAYIMVGQTVPLISGVTTADEGQTYQTSQEEVGLILGVWPRISPDNVVIMEISAEKSSVGPEDEGIPISISATGEVVRTPRIDRTMAETSVSAADGQTVILGGLITKQKSEVSRKVPYLANLPIVGALFRYDAFQERRTELLFILTPHVIRSQEDAELLKQQESARMNWCLCDVMELADDAGLRTRIDEWPDSETTVIYPDADSIDPMMVLPEEVPAERPIIAPPNDGAYVPNYSVPAQYAPVQQAAPNVMYGPQYATPQQVQNVARPLPQTTNRQTSALQQGARGELVAERTRYQPQVYPVVNQQPAATWAGASEPQPMHGTAVPLGYNAPSAPYQQPAAQYPEQYPQQNVRPAQQPQNVPQYPQQYAPQYPQANAPQYAPQYQPAMAQGPAYQVPTYR